MNLPARRGPLVLLLCFLLFLPLRPPPAFPDSPPDSLPDSPPDTRLHDDKLVHFLAGLAVGLSAGGALIALAPEADSRPVSAGAFGLAAGLLAGAGKEAMDARRGSGGRVEAADLLHTLLGGLVGGVLAEAAVRSGQAAGLPPRWIGVGLALGGGAAGFAILRAARP